MNTLVTMITFLLWVVYIVILYKVLFDFGIIPMAMCLALYLTYESCIKRSK